MNNSITWEQLISIADKRSIERRFVSADANDPHGDIVRVSFTWRGAAFEGQYSCDNLGLYAIYVVTPETLFFGNASDVETDSDQPETTE
jgi:hypothetical protein